MKEPVRRGPDGEEWGPRVDRISGLSIIDFFKDFSGIRYSRSSDFVDFGRDGPDNPYPDRDGG